MLPNLLPTRSNTLVLQTRVGSLNAPTNEVARFSWATSQKAIGLSAPSFSTASRATGTPGNSQFNPNKTTGFQVQPNLQTAASGSKVNLAFQNRTGGINAAVRNDFGNQRFVDGAKNYGTFSSFNRGGSPNLAAGSYKSTEGSKQTSSAINSERVVTPLVSIFNPDLPVFTITIDTTGLQGLGFGPNGGFEFTFASGDTGNGINSAIVGNILTDGAGFDPNSGTGATNNGNGFYTLTDPNSFGNFRNLDFKSASFTFGTFISFEVQVTQNGPFTATPDAFSVTFLNSNGGQLPTTDPNGTGQLVLIPIASTTPITTADIQIFPGTLEANPYGQTTTVVLNAVPEPSPLIPLALGAVLVGGAATLRNRKLS
jgi:hypothetical protein